MPVTVSDDEYKELQVLRSHCIREENIKSVQSMQMLENDIDAPIRRIVGMFALLGCKPTFSCCGFDYRGQPIHKTHEYGNAYVTLRDTPDTDQVINVLVEKDFFVRGSGKTSQWRTWKMEKAKIVFVALAFDWADREADYPWTKTNCIHYSEKGVIGLKQLQDVLSAFESVFLDSIVLSDTNVGHNKSLEYWQYPALEPWQILKENILI